MSMQENDETLVRQTISRLLDFHGMEIASEGESKKPAESDESIQPPAFEHLELGDPIAAAVAEEEFAEGSFDDWGESQTGFTPRRRTRHVRQKKMVLMIPVLAILLLLVLNKFHGMPLMGSEWLRLGTYEKMVGEIVDSGFSSIAEDGGQHPVRLKVRGIAFTSERPSAVVGTTIVHEGDIVLGATVVEISRSNVKFEVNGETWTQKVQ